MSFDQTGIHSIRCAAFDAVGPDDVRWIPDAWIAWDASGVITAVAPWAGQVVDLHVPGGVATAGFVDGHVHAAQTRIVGAASGPLLDWLATSTFPEETGLADEARAASIYDVFCRQLLAGGTTTALAWSSAHEGAADALFAAAAGTGLRLIGGPVWMDEGAPTALLSDVPATVARVERLVERWHGAHGRLEVAVLPRFALSCSEPMLAAAGAFAARHGLVVSTHLSENPAEVQAVRDRFGLGYAEVYDRAGLLMPGTVLAHCIHPTEQEWDLLTARGAVVAHCPDSNDFLGSGGMPAQIPVPMVLGTDVAAGRSFRVPRVASAGFDNALRQGVRVPPETWLWHATAGGAAALGRGAEGRLAVGAAADVAVHRLPPWVESAQEALGWLMFAADAPPCAATFVAGRCVWRHEGPVWPVWGG